MHQSIDKKIKIYLYLILFLFLSSINNFNFKKNFDDFFSIKKIELSNNKFDFDIKKLLDQNIFYINKEQINILMNKHAFLNSFQVNKIYPNSLKIDFNETTALAKIYLDGELFYIGENGNIFNYNNLELDLPIIKGYADIPKINLFLKKIINSPINYSNIDYFVYHPSNRWDIYFKNDLLVKLPFDLQVDLLKKIQAIIENKDIKKKIIDLRIVNKVILSNE